MISSVSHFMWGNFSKQEIKKTGLLSLGLLCVISAYWIMRPIKNSIFISFVGKQGLPFAKIVSLTSLVFLLIIYAKLIDRFKPHVLMYIVASIISLFVFIVAAFFPLVSSINQGNSLCNCYFGYVVFVGFECSLSLLFNLFWSFLSDAMNKHEAKKMYPLIIISSQLCATIIPLLTIKAQLIGIARLLVIAGGCVIGLALVIIFFMQTYSIAVKNDFEQRKRKTGALEGLYLFAKHPYLLGVFLISIIPEIIQETLHFLMLYQAESTYSSPEKIVSFLGYFSMSTNCFSLLLALLGTSFILRNQHIKTWLLVYPSVTVAILVYVFLFFDLWVVMYGLAILKGLGQAFDRPCREIIFIPTSTDIKFKSKSWIGAFGLRAAGGMSATFASFFPVIQHFLFNGTLFCLGITCIWVPAAYFVGRLNAKLVDQDTILK